MKTLSLMTVTFSKHTNFKINFEHMSLIFHKIKPFASMPDLRKKIPITSNERQKCPKLVENMLEELDHMLNSYETQSRNVKNISD
jgi:hypothetical protein